MSEKDEPLDEMLKVTQEDLLKHVEEHNKKLHQLEKNDEKPEESLDIDSEERESFKKSNKLIQKPLT
jgi:hypothetical protein